MNSWNLPTSVTIAGVLWDIRTDYKIVINVFRALENPNYDNEEKIMYYLMSMIVDFENLPEEHYEEAMKALGEFIDMGLDDGAPHPKTMDWEQDAHMIIPEINKQIGNGVDVRAMKMHWWTFLGYYMGIGESTFTHIINIRNKRAKGKKLEKWEKEFERENKSLVALKTKLSAAEIEEKERLERMLNQ